MPEYNVVVKMVPAMVIASRAVTIPTNDQVPVYLDTALFEAYNHAHAACVSWRAARWALCQPDLH